MKRFLAVFITLAAVAVSIEGATHTVTINNQDDALMSECWGWIPNLSPFTRHYNQQDIANSKSRTITWTDAADKFELVRCHLKSKGLIQREATFAVYDRRKGLAQISRWNVFVKSDGIYNGNFKTDVAWI